MKKYIILCSCFVSMFLLCSCGCSHDWQEATCEVPKICAICGETEGEVIAHEWSEATCMMPKTCTFCGKTEGDAMAHEWVAATCTEPKTCFTCKETEGNANGHVLVEATCTTPERCSVCGFENGAALGHTLTDTSRVKEPTCTEVGLEEGVCTLCNKTLSEEIPMLEHVLGDWAVAVEATYDASGKKEIACQACNIVIEEQEYELTEEEKEEWYKGACEKVAYKEFARYPEDYEGKRVLIKGEVGMHLDESITDSDFPVYYIDTDSSYGFYSGDPVYAVVENVSTRILEGDIVTFYGELAGIQDLCVGEYPVLNVVYYEIK